MFDFGQIISDRRSIRDFREQEVPLVILKDIIRDCAYAPSAGNRQPWQFIIIRNKKMIKKLSQESKKNFLDRKESDAGSLINRYDTLLRDDLYNVFYNAPCLVYIAGDKNIRSLDVDCACAATYFMFSAASRGLGTCWVDLGGNIKDQGLRDEIGLPNGHRLVAPLIVGYPRKSPRIPRRKMPVIIKTVE